MARGSAAKMKPPFPKHDAPTDAAGAVRDVAAMAQIDQGFPPPQANGSAPRPAGAVVPFNEGPCPELPEDALPVVRVRFRPGEMVTIANQNRRLIEPKDRLRMVLEGPLLWIERKTQLNAKTRREVWCVPITNIQVIEFPKEEK